MPFDPENIALPFMCADPKKLRINLSHNRTSIEIYHKDSVMKMETAKCAW